MKLQTKLQDIAEKLSITLTLKSTGKKKKKYFTVIYKKVV